MATLLDKCSTCFEAKLNACADKIILSANLTPGTDYVIIAVDKFNNKYRNNYTADEDGNITILTEDYQEGLFNQFSGAFTFTIWNNDLSTQYEFDLNGTIYSCIIAIFEVVYYGNDEPDEIVDIINFAGTETIDICCRETSKDGIVAFAGGGQVNATTLTDNYNIIDICASPNDSCKTDAATLGRLRAINNNGINDMELFPAIGERFNINGSDLLINQSIIIAPGNTFVFRCFTTGIYRT